jgi:acyl-CoA reductase-like NAD-dependent aldehyde dehydrogenase
MRPHRVLVHQSLAAAFLAELAGRLANLRIRIDPEAATTLRRLLQDANRRGANQLQGKCDGQLVTPFVLSNVAPDSALCNAAIFAPVLAVNEFGSIEKAVQMHNACDYGLTASIFGRELQARSLVQQLNAGTVVINDLIVPTADSRLPFSGRKQSGYGSTRGAEGLLEFTRLKAVTVRRSQYRHLDTPHASDAALFSGVITALHGHGAVNRLRGAAHAIRAALRRNKRAKRSATHAQF